jgi:hypothetical protein
MNIENINQLIQQSQCDATCQKNNKIRDLKEKYIEAQQYKTNGPIVLQQAAKNYYTFAEGENAYNEYLEKEIETQSTQVAKQLQTTFTINQEKVEQLEDTIYTLSVNLKHSIDLYLKLLGDNVYLSKNVLDLKDSVLLNYRQTYYEEQEIELLKSWATMYFWIYYLLLFGIVFIVIFKRENLVKWFFALLFLFIFPFLINPTINILYTFLQYLYSFSPVNVYR